MSGVSEKTTDMDVSSELVLQKNQHDLLSAQVSSMQRQLNDVTQKYLHHVSVTSYLEKEINELKGREKTNSEKLDRFESRMQMMDLKLDGAEEINELKEGEKNVSEKLDSYQRGMLTMDLKLDRAEERLAQTALDMQVRSADPGVVSDDSKPGTLLDQDASKESSEVVENLETSKSEHAKSSIPTTHVPIQTLTRSYALEENVYGLLVMPGRVMHVGPWVILLINYFIIGALSAAIFFATFDEYKGFKEELIGDDDSLCQMRETEIDCTPSLLDTMTNFNNLDTNGDGVWSIQEARDSQFLPHFVAVHEISLESQALLRILFPPRQAQPDLFCSSAVSNAIENIWSENTSNKFVQDFVMQDELRWVHYAFQRAQEERGGAICEFGEEEDDDDDDDEEDRPLAILCFQQWLCTMLPGKPFETAKQQYVNATDAMSLFTADLYEKLIQNLLNPCRIITPDMCANAESAGTSFLPSVPQWASLTASKRIEQCRAHVKDICPRLFGDRYSQFEKRAFQSGGVCGEPSWDEEEVIKTVSSAKPTPACRDDSPAWEKTMATLGAHDRTLQLFFDAYAATDELPTTCSQILDIDDGIERWCESADIWPDLASAQNNASLAGDVFGRVCPQTCCQRTSLGCPTYCFSNVIVSNAVKTRIAEAKCLGTNCGDEDLSMRGDNITGNIRFSFLKDFQNRENRFKIAIDASTDLRVYILNLNLGSQKLDPDCKQDSVLMAGVRICEGNRQEYPYVDLQPGLAEIFILQVTDCSSTLERPCGWEIMITEAGSPTTTKVGFVYFARQQLYGGELTGTMHVTFIIFLPLVLLLWCIYLSPELFKIYELGLFVFEDPAGCGHAWQWECALVVLLPRFAVSAWILFVGAFLFVAVPTFMDIVLNSVALGFILEIDECLYMFFTPSAVKDILASQEPFSLQARELRPRFIEVNIALRAVLMLAIIGGATAFMYNGYEGFAETADLMECLCSRSGQQCSNAIMQST